MKRAILVLCVTAGTASGEPQPLPAPSPWPPPPQSDYRLEAAAHVGLATVDDDTGDYEVSGGGVAGDLELGFRYRRLSLLGHVDVMHVTDTAQHVSALFIGGGVRARVHIGTAFLGIGLGAEGGARYRGTVDDDGERITRALGAPVVELHGGFTLPVAIHGWHPQLLVAVQVFPAEDDAFAAVRIGIGLAR